MNDTQYNKSDVPHFSDSLSYFELILAVTIMTVICIVTLIGNALVVISFILDKNLRTLNNYFLLSLAASDIMIASFSMPLFTLYVWCGEWILGSVMCDMWLAQDYMCSNASGLNLLVISFDRYFSVTSPLRYRARRNGKHVAMMISCVWILAFLIWPPWIYAWPYIDGKRTVPEDDCYVQFLETNSYLTVVTAVMAYYIPVSIMFVLYFRIWRETEKRKQYLTSMESKVNNENAQLQNGKRCKEKWSNFFSCCAFKYGSSGKQKSGISNNAIELYTASCPEMSTSRFLPKCNDECEESKNTESVEEPIADCETPALSDPKYFSKESVQLRMSSSKSIGGKHENKAAKTLTAILLAFIITTTPYNVLVLIRNFDITHTVISDPVWNFFYYLFYVNSTLNPVCYALANTNFRKTYWRILTCVWCNSKRKSNLNHSPDKLPQNRSSEEAKFLTSPL